MSSKAEQADCEHCPLKDAAFAPTQFPTRELSAGLVAFVSRSPGKHDVRAGKPFAGLSGEVLDYLLDRYGVSRDQIITTNTVLCQTDDPPTDAIKACRHRLEHDIADADLVIAGGTEATAALTRYRTVANSRGFSITRTSPVSGKPQRVVVTNNPAAVIRDSDKFPDMVADFKRAFDPPPKHVFPEVEVVSDVGRASDIMGRWLTSEFTVLASDLEWHGTDIFAAGFSARPTKAIVFTRECFESDGGSGFRRKIKQFYERDDIRFIWHNGKADTKILRWNGIDGRIDEDTFLMSIALDERPGYHSLEYMLSNEFGWPDYEPESVKHFKKTGEFKDPVTMSQRDLYKYNGYDTAGTLQLFNLLTQRIEEN